MNNVWISVKHFRQFLHGHEEWKKTRKIIRPDFFYFYFQLQENMTFALFGVTNFSSLEVCS